MLHTSVRYQLDGDEYPTTANIQFTIGPDGTAITFPSGAVKTFPNWEVRGIRQRTYQEEVNMSADDYLKTVQFHTELKDFGVRPQDIQRFVGELAEKPKYEVLFLQKSGHKIGA